MKVIIELKFYVDQSCNGGCCPTPTSILGLMDPVTVLNILYNARETEPLFFILGDYHWP